jgi:hypothetical protein
LLFEFNLRRHTKVGAANAKTEAAESRVRLAEAQSEGLKRRIEHMERGKQMEWEKEVREAELASAAM